MHIKTILDNVASFLVEPHKQDSSPHIKKLAWATTIILGVGTLGIVQGLSLLWKKIRANPHNRADKKVNEIGQFLLKPAQVNKKFTLPKGNIKPEIISEEESSKPQSLQAIAQNIYNRREALWEAAKTESAKQGAVGDENVMLCFINSIKAEFTKEGSSLSDISENSESLNALFKSNRLRLAVLYYARINELNSLIKQHLNYVVDEFTNQEANYINKVIELAKKKRIQEPIKILEILINLIKINFENEGYNLEKIHKYPELFNVFKQNPLLNLIIDYLNKKRDDFSKPPIVSVDNNPEIKRREEAIHLGKEHAQEGVGLLTKLHLKDVPEEELAKAVKKELLQNHPDKNKDADPALVQDLNQLLELIRHDNLKLYQQVLEQKRH